MVIDAFVKTWQVDSRMCRNGCPAAPGAGAMRVCFAVALSGLLKFGQGNRSGLDHRLVSMSSISRRRHRTLPIAAYAPKTYTCPVGTVVESPIFQKLWPLYWDEEERAEFAAHIASNPEEGVVIRGSGGV